MKQYFSKYLSVEEVIEVGDTVNGNYEDKRYENPIGKVISIEGNLPNRKIEINYNRSYKCIGGLEKNGKWNEFSLKKIKLFLCTRNMVQTGTYDLEGYKVVGEILTSRIKEGQEFTEDEKDFLTIK